MGNEGDVEMFVENTGFMYEIAPQFKALIVFIEHRYYGKSIPFGGNLSVAYSNTSTLGYLSSAQALADYATLIVDLKKNLTAEGSPVIVFGGSYGGMLAAWFRLKYPHIAVGALASSAPIRQFENMVSQYSFTDIITQDYKSASESCYKAIKGSWCQIEETAKKENGLELLRKSLKICDNHISVDSLQRWLQSAFIYMAMSDYPTPANFIKSLPAYPVREMCKAIDDPKTGDDIFAKLYGAANIYYNSTGKTTCFDLQDDSDPRNIDFPAWKWQCCTELVLLTDANRHDSIFPQSENDPESRKMSCNESYNGMISRPHWITTEYGGHDIKRILEGFASNIIFFNGLRDPWSGGGILRNISESLVAIVAKEGAHHVDLRSSCKDDPDWLKDVRNQEISIMRKWLTEYYCDFNITSPLL
ncbi:lysosomal Pro-Xaa carboxypeptidase [Ranunculus cassubicifolius]